MTLAEIKEQYNQISKQVKDLEEILKPKDLELEISRFEEKMNEPTFWNDQRAAREIIKKANELKNRAEKYSSLVKLRENIEASIELMSLEEDPEIMVELETSLKSLSEMRSNLEISLLLSGKYDNNNAIFSIHPGAGGTDAQDWAQMLQRMYFRWFESKKYKVTVIDQQAGDVAGIKSLTAIVAGPYAYGYLKCEAGVHRLVRISPFDASKARHTSFASVDVVPEFDDDIEIEINESDLKIDTYRSSGAGGQHVNVTDSAVRITHLPTGIVVACQNERSQWANKDLAMKILKNRLYEHEMAKKAEELKELRGTKSKIEWGSQIRSYVFCPYNLVKDHRTGHEEGNVAAVMDGKIDDFIWAYLQYLSKNQG